MGFSPLILLVVIYLVFLIVRRHKMPKRESLKTILELFVTWIVIFGVALAIPDLSMIYKVLIGVISGIGLILFGIYFFNLKEDAEPSFYSPLHAMIVKVNMATPREKALKFSVGNWVNVKELGIDYQSVSTAFTQNATKFKDEDLTKWAEIEKQINAYSSGGGFFINKDVQEWFDDLEARYNH
jgi:hypothetical protein